MVLKKLTTGKINFLMPRGELHQTDRPELSTDHQVIESGWSEEVKMYTLERSSKRTFYLEG